MPEKLLTLSSNAFPLLKALLARPSLRLLAVPNTTLEPAFNFRRDAHSLWHSFKSLPTVVPFTFWRGRQPITLWSSKRQADNLPPLLGSGVSGILIHAFLRFPKVGAS